MGKGKKDKSRLDKAPRAGVAAMVPLSFDLSTPQATFRLPLAQHGWESDGVSGVSYNTDTKLLALVSDRSASVALYDEHKMAIVSVVPFAHNESNVDFEDVAWAGPDRLFVLRSGGTLFEVTQLSDKSVGAVRKLELPNLNKDDNCEGALALAQRVSIYATHVVVRRLVLRGGDQCTLDRV